MVSNELGLLFKGDYIEFLNQYTSRNVTFHYNTVSKIEEYINRNDYDHLYEDYDNGSGVLFHIVFYNKKHFDKLLLGFVTHLTLPQMKGPVKGIAKNKLFLRENL